jgi:hypothetical protein
VKIVAVSTDPRGDTSAAVRAFLALHGMTGRMEYLIGTRRALTPVWKSWGVSASNPTAGDQVSHTAAIYGISASGRVMTLYASNFKPSDIARRAPARLPISCALRRFGPRRNRRSGARRRRDAALERAARALGARASVVGVDWSDNGGYARKFVRRYRWSFSVLEDPDGKSGYAYGIQGLPSAFVLNAHGAIVRRLLGPQTVAGLVRAVSQSGVS